VLNPRENQIVAAHACTDAHALHMVHSIEYEMKLERERFHQQITVSINN
jgi:hypothetical protein